MYLSTTERAMLESTLLNLWKNQSGNNVTVTEDLSTITDSELEKIINDLLAA